MKFLLWLGGSKENTISNVSSLIAALPMSLDTRTPPSSSFNFINRRCFLLNITRNPSQWQHLRVSRLEILIGGNFYQPSSLQGCLNTIGENAIIGSLVVVCFAASNILLDFLLLIGACCGVRWERWEIPQLAWLWQLYECFTSQMSSATLAPVYDAPDHPPGLPHCHLLLSSRHLSSPPGNFWV